MNVGNLTSGSSAFSKSSLNIWKFSVHVLLKPTLDDFEYDLTQKAKWLSEELLQIAEKRREAKGKGEKEIPI